MGFLVDFNGNHSTFEVKCLLLRWLLYQSHIGSGRPVEPHKLPNLCVGSKLVDVLIFPFSKLQWQWWWVAMVMVSSLKVSERLSPSPLSMLDSIEPRVEVRSQLCSPPFPPIFSPGHVWRSFIPHGKLHHHWEFSPDKWSVMSATYSPCSIGNLGSYEGWRTLVPRTDSWAFFMPD